MNAQQTTFWNKVLDGNNKRIAELEALVATKTASGTYYQNQLKDAKARNAQIIAKLNS
jgi:hypothetical protein